MRPDAVPLYPAEQDRRATQPTRLVSRARARVRSLEVDAADLAASQRRHPSSCESNDQQHSPCGTCGFQPPLRHYLGSAVRELVAGWREIVGRDRAAVTAVASLRDELHAVANRVSRILAAPGAALAPVRLDEPTALSTSSDPNLLLRFLRMSADRLADLVQNLTPEQWQLSGRVGSSTVTIPQLLVVPLHASHRRSLGDAWHPNVIELDTYRWRTDSGPSPIRPAS